MVSGERSEKRLLSDFQTMMNNLLPVGWCSRLAKRPSRNDAPDFLLTLAAPSGESVIVVGEIKARLEPRGVADVVARLRTLPEGNSPSVPLVLSSYLSPRSRELLEANDMSYADETGNVRIVSVRPGLFIRTQGAQRDPKPSDESLQSLRSAGAIRTVRAVVDSRPPYGIRELAKKTGSPLASLSRVVDLLDRESLIERDDGGRVREVDWANVIRRWAQDYAVLKAHDVETFIEPRGLAALEDRLSSAGLVYAATGAFAAQRFDPLAPARTAALYVDDIDKAAKKLNLRAADNGSNVWLMEPSSPAVFERTLQREGTVCVAPSQLAVDLLTGSGREPSQGEAILEWMQRNENVWRS